MYRRREAFRSSQKSEGAGEEDGRVDAETRKCEYEGDLLVI